jgi:hypothetical protein
LIDFDGKGFVAELLDEPWKINTRGIQHGNFAKWNNFLMGINNDFIE